MKIEVNKVTKKFKNVEVLKDINITFESGKIYGLIGRNGSGKTVLLKILCGFYAPTSGDVIVNGENIVKNKTFPKNTRALIEKPGFLPELTGYENLEILAKIQNKIGEKEIMETVEQVNLQNDINKKYANYSLGTKQKLGIVQVLMEDPDIMIFDEPFNGIENKTAESLRKLLLKLKKQGKLIIIASHIKEDIYNLADEIYEFDDGYITKQKRNFN
ncbi:MAG: ATP-binding cassette domain-containing protein [Bacilli bacterium]|nr:ATP-binding cassette domain-containing protein [Bacilli bacterium]MDD4733641.1 ATP-binding cassette domain-containing protein [Bacilli bacterium]